MSARFKSVSMGKIENFKVSKFSEDLAKLSDKKKIEAAVFNQLSEIKQALVQEWHKKKKNLTLIKKILGDSMWLIAKMSSLQEGEPSSEKNLLITQEILEIGVRYSVAEKDMQSFDRYMAQLKSYYFDLKQHFKTESPSMYELLGLNLLKLLTENRIPEFHTQLELFVHTDVNRVLKDPYISNVVAIEQNLTEGRFNRVYKARENSVSPDYKYFIDILLDTTKDGMADCVEAAYERLMMKDAAELLNFTNQTEIEAFSKKRNWKKDKNGFLCFDCGKDPFFVSEEDRSTLIKDALMYAKELEMIV